MATSADVRAQASKASGSGDPLIGIKTFPVAEMRHQ